jgi:S-formylglutathione hydrolase
MKVLKEHKSFNGSVRFWEHDSVLTKTKMKFSTFTPPGKIKGAIIWLSGLTCTDENFMTKAGAQKYLAASQVMLISPDTSPRGLSLPHEHDAFDFGSGASFYVNATTAGYKDHYLMYDYIAHEVYELLQKEFSVGDHISISGHSMGGHGAIVIGLSEKEKFKSISAFAPILNPTRSSWGEKAFTGYLGDDRKNWGKYDACELIANGYSHPQPILIDQGSADEFLEKQLTPEKFRDACSNSGKQELMLRVQQGYDHSYYFISTFIRDHVEFHASRLVSG